jgi:N-acetylmuramate 1-kinase
MDPAVIPSLCEESRQMIPGWGCALPEVAPIEKGGSDRRYYRLTGVGREGGPETAILMVYTANRPDNLSFFAATEVLAGAGLRMPRIYAHDGERRCAWLEDLGRDDLWEWRERDGERGALYRSTLRQAAKIHAIEPEALRGGLVGGELQPPFDEGLYQWEQDYFFREFASRFSVLTAEELEEVRLGEGLADVRRTLAALPRRMVHRDFQSQNVIVRDGQAWLIDYQGLRPGRPEYDLASLLYDPYVRLPDGERRELLAYYAGLHGAGEAFGSDAGVFARCACQRLMQALGAYGKLGVGDGKKAFLEHIPNAVANLRSVLAESGLLPELVRVLELRPGAVEAAGGPRVGA